MKNAIKNLAFSAIVLCLACSFANAPGSAGATNSQTDIVEPVGGAYLIFAGKYGGSITKREMDGKDQLGVDGCARGSKIFQYVLEVTKGGKTSSFQAKSNLLTPEMVTKLKSLSTGDAFEFKQVKAHLPNGKDVVEVRSERFVVA